MVATAAGAPVIRGKPAMYSLFDLETDPFELENIYNATMAMAAWAQLLEELHALVERYQSCTGVSCP